MPPSQLDLRLLQCPVTGGALGDVSAPRSPALRLGSLENEFRRALDPRDDGPHWVGESGGIRYPVLGSVPLLTREHAYDADGPLPGSRPAVASHDLDFYNTVALREARDIERSEVFRQVCLAARTPGGFPDDITAWISSPYDGTAQLRAYRFLAPIVRDGRVAQLGGQGSHAVKLLIAGARQAVVVSPVLGELVFALECAERVGVRENLDAVLGAGEQLPLADSSLSGVFCGSTLHHMNTAVAGREVSRVLTPGGRFAAMEPWRVPVLYRAGVSIMGKREAVDCTPLDPARLAAFMSTFAGQVEVRQHGALIRYPLLALGKLGIRPKKDLMVRLMMQDDARARPLRRLGGSMSITGMSALADVHR